MKHKILKSLLAMLLLTISIQVNAGFDWEGADEPAPEQPPHQLVTL